MFRHFSLSAPFGLCLLFLIFENRVNGLQCLVAKEPGVAPKPESCSTFCGGVKAEVKEGTLIMYECLSEADAKDKIIKNKMNKCSNPFETSKDGKTMKVVFCICNTDLCNDPDKLNTLERFTLTPDEIKEMENRDGENAGGSGGSSGGHNGGLQCLIAKEQGVAPKPESCSTFCAGSIAVANGNKGIKLDCAPEAEAKNKIFENKMNKCSNPFELSKDGTTAQVVTCFCDTDLCNDPNKLNTLEKFTFTPDEINEIKNRDGQSIGGSGGSSGGHNGGLRCFVAKEQGVAPKPESCSTFCGGSIAEVNGQTLVIFECLSEAEAKNKILENKMNKCSNQFEASKDGITAKVIMCICNTDLCNDPNKLKTLEKFTFTPDEIKEFEKGPSGSATNKQDGADGNSSGSTSFVISCIVSIIFCALF